MATVEFINTTSKDVSCKKGDRHNTQTKQGSVDHDRGGAHRKVFSNQSSHSIRLFNSQSLVKGNNTIVSSTIAICEIYNSLKHTPFVHTFMNFGASYYMVNLEGMLHTYSPYQGSTQVMLGDGSLLPIKKCGFYGYSYSIIFPNT